MTCLVRSGRCPLTTHIFKVRQLLAVCAFLALCWTFAARLSPICLLSFPISVAFTLIADDVVLYAIRLNCSLSWLLSGHYSPDTSSCVIDTSRQRSALRLFRSEDFDADASKPLNEFLVVCRKKRCNFIHHSLYSCSFFFLETGAFIA